MFITRVESTHVEPVVAILPGATLPVCMVRFLSMDVDPFPFALQCCRVLEQGRHGKSSS